MAKLLHNLQYLKLLTQIFICVSLCMSCQNKNMKLEVYQTSRTGTKFEKINQFSTKNSDNNFEVIEIFPNQKFQKITGFGGSFTEATCHLLSSLNAENRTLILESYFSKEEAHYSLTRTTIASCDFSLDHYTYAPIPNDTSMEHFTITHDQKEIIPIIKQAQKIANNEFKIIASPWTCPPWMKDNKLWVGGKLLPEFYPSYALYFEKYLEAYKKEGIDIWGLTAINEPHGNGNNWESTHFTPKEMTDFIEFHLGPSLEKSKFKHVKILGYDQNRAGLKEWVEEMYRSENSTKYFAGTAIHWYESTYDYFPDALDYASKKAPDKHLIQTEACVDSEVPQWQNDDWYWQKEATDWGWNWASDKDKHLHPKYAPVHRYATDIIGCLNHGVDGWIDWNMVLDKQGGPNWFKNWCIAPVIVDIELNQVYYTPLYYVLKHFSKFIRPGAVRIGWKKSKENEIMTTAIQNPDKSIVVLVFNPTTKENNFTIQVEGFKQNVSIPSESIQTIVINKI